VPIPPINYSRIASFKFCRRQYFLGYYWELEPKIPSFSSAPAIGTRVHKSMAAWYQEWKDNQTIQTPLPQYHALVVAQDWSRMLDVYRQHQDREPPEGITQAFLKATDLEQIMLDGYEEWLAESGNDEDIQEILGVEEVISTVLPVPDYGGTVTIVGTLDLRYRTNGGFTVIRDYKTVASFVKRSALLPMNEQFKMYMLLNRYDSLVTDPTYRDLYTNGELVMLRKVKRTAAANPPFYMRVPVAHGSDTLNAFRRQIQGTITEMLMLHSALDSGKVHYDDVAYPTPNDYCESCPFFVPCQMMDDGSRWQAYLRDHYQKKPPDSYITMNENGREEAEIA
jgi:PD-(D/E)XK nuclease superfamily